MPSRTLPAAAAAALLSFAHHADAQLATDRPDFVESAATVGPGALQVETSVAYEHSGSDALRWASWSVPTLIRIGWGRTFELRFESDVLVQDRSSSGPEGRSGVADPSVGVKWHLLDAGGSKPAGALLLHLDLPVGGEEVRSEAIRPSVRAVAEWELPRGLALGVMPGFARGTNRGATYPSGILGVVVGKSLTSTFRVFGELAWEQIAAREHGGHVGTWNAGAALLLSDWIQVDAAISRAASDGAPDTAFTLGVSRLFLR
jgi:hypothetical protein